MRLLAAFLLLALAGCQDPPTVSQIEARCEVEASKAYALDFTDRFAMVEKFTQTCMRAEGYEFAERAPQCLDPTLTGAVSRMNPVCYYRAR